MANAILSAERNNNEYQLEIVHRRTLVEKADNLGGKIPPRALQKIERQRIRFIRFYGSAF